ncbi:LytR C-terminal domain-containing protein [Cryobacterium psychrophilum]|uniref:LytR family transcriptional regulator n=1 Tax=Cryobacterium psychrophilum TaxID=41988 RepID=A0A4Y8KS00_9MICO|nr:LytR C-terminal domain-containing protein [Cryobacterium psychrophilum]TDW29486.1 LytR cell envelope-related transcriptional attenuator [Cryobacterium psychrophilum]TFD81380.1 LytR family transcriptional regulator [Cryobacterium psychrophilum]
MPTHDVKDRFDHVPHDLHRVGAHRAPGRKGRGWVAFWWALAATIVLIGVGVVGILSLNDRLSFTVPGSSPSATSTETATPSETPAPTAVATVAPELSVTVLNGSSSNGVAASASQTLTDAGWNVGATSNANVQDQPTTIVYYADASLEGAALGIAQSIPGAQVLLANDFVDSGGDLTVVVGNDYVIP